MPKSKPPRKRGTGPAGPIPRDRRTVVARGRDTPDRSARGGAQRPTPLAQETAGKRRKQVGPTGPGGALSSGAVFRNRIFRLIGA